MKICYNCGGPADSMDHLPPKSFYLKPAPSNLITAPCCTACNNSFSFIDEKFRAFVSADEQCNSAGLLMLKTKVLSSNSMKGRPFIELALSARKVPVTDGKSTYVKQKISLPETEARSFLIRLTKGLMSKIYPDLDRAHGRFCVEYLSDPSEDNPVFEKIKRVVPSMEFQEIGEGVFAFWRIANQNASIWIYCFYHGATFSVVHSLNNC